ncbi:hypothetical protein MMC15_001514 [Xylographa vitiligo]|nr:hypothetical protein [Xylographa vitiligo]
MGRHAPLHHHHHHHRHHYHRSSSISTTAPPTVQTLRRIRALSDTDHELLPEADRGPQAPTSWEWEWERWDFAAAAHTVGAGIELGLGLERIGGWIPGLKRTAGESIDWAGGVSFGFPCCVVLVVLAQTGGGADGAGFYGRNSELTTSRCGGEAPTAFLSTLRQNLALTTSLLPPDSPATTASSMSSPPSLHSSATLPPPSPPSAPPLTPPSSSSSSSSEGATSSATPLRPTTTSTVPTPSDLPPLITIPATTSAHRHSALHLLASALAQRRQLACALLIRSPAFLALAALALALVLQTTSTGRRASLPLVGTTFAGVVMALLIGARWLAGGYLDLAERVGWDWLGEDEVWVSLWGVEEAVVGAVVVRTEKGEGRRRRRGVVRGWTVRARERGRGVGRGLLEVVVGVGRERGWEGVGVEEGGICEFFVIFLFSCGAGVRGCGLMSGGGRRS